MARGLNGRVAVVAGAATGIGRAVALRLAQDGAAVIVNYAGSTQQPQATVGLIEQGGERGLLHALTQFRSSPSPSLSTPQKRGPLSKKALQVGVMIVDEPGPA